MGILFDVYVLTPHKLSEGCLEWCSFISIWFWFMFWADGWLRCDVFWAGVMCLTLGVIYYITIIYCILYYIILLYIYYYILYYYYIIYYLILLLYILYSSLLPSSVLPFFPYNPPLLSFQYSSIYLSFLSPSKYSFYTCRYLHILIYILSKYSRIIWPRTFYRSGWLRCVVRICVGF